MEWLCWLAQSLCLGCCAVQGLDLRENVVFSLPSQQRGVQGVQFRRPQLQTAEYRRDRALTWLLRTPKSG